MYPCPLMHCHALQSLCFLLRRPLSTSPTSAVQLPRAHYLRAFTYNSIRFFRFPHCHIPPLLTSSTPPLRMCMHHSVRFNLYLPHCHPSHLSTSKHSDDQGCAGLIHINMIQLSTCILVLFMLCHALQSPCSLSLILLSTSPTSASQLPELTRCVSLFIDPSASSFALHIAILCLFRLQALLFCVL